MSVPRLANGVRMHWDSVREQHVLLIPEGAVQLNATAAQTLELCDGVATVEQIVLTLSERFESEDIGDDVRELLEALRERGFVVDADDT